MYKVFIRNAQAYAIVKDYILKWELGLLIQLINFTKLRNINDDMKKGKLINHHIEKLEPFM